MANLFNRVGMALTAGLSAGWTAALAAYSQNALVDDVALDRQDFGYFPYRQSRYDLYWALYENSAYGDKNDSLHYFTKGLKEDRRLYKGIAHILNPIFRVVSFHEGHIWGGVLGKDAGDEDAETCLPVVTDQPAVRPEIARLWRRRSCSTRTPARGRSSTPPMSTPAPTRSPCRAITRGRWNSSGS
jgi:hypothetical protein